MKKTLLIVTSLVLSTLSFAQKVEYKEAQTRVIEPLQDVYVRPMVADLEILSENRKTYGPTLYFENYKLSDILTRLDAAEVLEQAKIFATYQAAKEENADVIVGATYMVTHHIDASGKISENGVDITVNGYPARYVNWHKMGEVSTDKDWVPYLIQGQTARSKFNNEQKTEAVKGK